MNQEKKNTNQEGDMMWSEARKKLQEMWIYGTK